MFAALGEPKPEHFELVIGDICKLRGADYAQVQLIVGSSPCQDFSYRAMPWKRAKALHAPFLGMHLFWQQFRIQREVSAARGEYVPMVVENVRGAIPWVGRSRGRYGSYHVWGDVPALMPQAGRSLRPKFIMDDIKNGQRRDVEGVYCDGRAIKNTGGSWFNIGSPGQKVTNQNPVHDGTKTPGFRFDGSGRSFQTASVEGQKMPGGTRWFNDGARTPDSLASSSSRSSARKAASARIAKIPQALSEWIGWAYLPPATHFATSNAHTLPLDSTQRDR